MTENNTAGYLILTLEALFIVALNKWDKLEGFGLSLCYKVADRMMCSWKIWPETKMRYKQEGNVVEKQYPLCLL